MLKMKKEKTIDGKTIVEWETELSGYCKKTLMFSEFKTYLRPKNFMNMKLSPFYNEHIFRKLSNYIRRQKTEARMHKYSLMV